MSRTLDAGTFYSASPAAGPWRAFAWAGPYAPLLALYAIGLLTLSASRIALMLWQDDRVAAAGIWETMLLQGVRVDIILLGLMAAVPLLLLPLLVSRRAWPLWRALTYGWVIAMVALLVFLEVATPAFIVEYGVRPNRFLIEYLKYPREVLSMLWGGYRVELVGGVLVTCTFAWLSARLLRPWKNAATRWKWWQSLLAWPLVVLLVAFGIRSTLDHRPANPAMFALTADTMINSLILNSAWSVAYEAYRMKDEATSSEIYGKMSEADIVAEVRAAAEGFGGPPRKWLSDDIPTLNALTPTHRRDKPLNLVIVLQESLGATFVESLGGVPVTPELEKLKHEGWWFEQLYATGTRSVRGIEGVTTGFLPTPAQAVVKLSLAQQGFFTLADLLARRGYHTEFVYGGEAHFDNMRRFFTGNGFTSIVDEKDYENPVFMGSWGASDEDLFAKAHERIRAVHAEGKPFFSLVFTSSNHSPFEFPDGRIELYDAERGTDRNAVKYADWAMGRFFEQARASDYWEDTVFLVVADHDIRVRGNTLIPVERFHIPGLILGADIEPRRIATVASQIDLGPTLLSLMGISADTPMIGRNLSAEPPGQPGRAMMQYEQNYGYMHGHELVVLRAQQPPVVATYDPVAKQLGGDTELAEDDARARRALAHVLLPSWLYREQRYRLPATASD
ncbi:LTA synthase family protein [Pseudazoarcus pumilus]|uniref:Sulfatase n=1 Tax=Pseudazoarcus pumilus TaxID=2067960 RepID=A0A2I6S584_9RHOO|nr:LTA synthase family protein [Pseudazoarcus pumilus]AUN94414.1 sulfatase [Pseudazoarcus pumilus]